MECLFRTRAAGGLPPSLATGMELTAPSRGSMRLQWWHFLLRVSLYVLIAGDKAQHLHRDKAERHSTTACNRRWVAGKDTLAPNSFRSHPVFPSFPCKDPIKADKICTLRWRGRRAAAVRITRERAGSEVEQDVTSRTSDNKYILVNPPPQGRPPACCLTQSHN